MISETKIGDSFPPENFLIKVFSLPYKVDRNSYGGDIFLFIKEYIASNLLAIDKKFDKVYLSN